MLIEKKDIDSYLGMLPDLVMSQCMKQYRYQEDEWIVLPFININDCAMALIEGLKRQEKQLLC